MTPHPRIPWEHHSRAMLNVADVEHHLRVIDLRQHIIGVAHIETLFTLHEDFNSRESAVSDVLHVFGHFLRVDL